MERAVTVALERVDAGMSSWRDDSELSAIRRGPGAVVVSEETGVVVRAALELAEATDGAFDPTVEPLMQLWGFRGDKLAEPPTDEQIEAARATVGHWRVSVFRHAGLTLVDAGGAALDLSSIAKGYAVDAVSDALSKAGVAHHLVEVGGEVRAAGEGPSGLWRLSVDVPDPAVPSGAGSLGVLPITNAALATSGNYRSLYEVDGQRVVHTMDPRTGRPIEREVLSATVLAPTCMEADGWATALMVLPVDEGMAHVERRPWIEALVVVDDQGAPKVVRSSGMPDVESSRR